MVVRFRLDRPRKGAWEEGKEPTMIALFHCSVFAWS